MSVSCLSPSTTMVDIQSKAHNFISILKVSFYKLYSFPFSREEREEIFCVYIQCSFLNKSKMVLYVLCQKPVN